MATFERLENNEVKFEITLDADAFSKGIDSAYRKSAKRYNVPGFRKGKAPRSMIQRHYGEAVFYEDAFEEVYWDAYVAAVQNADVTPVDSPSIKINQIGEGKELLFSAQVPVRPEITVEPNMYKGIELVRREYTVTDAQVDKRIDGERERLARYIEVERPIQSGDRVSFDYSGSVDLVSFEGGTAENQTLDIGSGRFIPGFEDQMIGMLAGGAKDITVTFPEDYNAPDLAGKEAVFAIKVHDVREKELSPLDDDFAKDISEFDTLEEYRANIRSEMEKAAQDQAKVNLQNEAIDSLVKKIEFNVPEAMINTAVDQSIEDMATRLKSQGISFEDYLAFTGTDIEVLIERERPRAENNVRAQLILEAIIKADESMAATDAQIEEEVAKLAESMKLSVEEVKEKLTDKHYDAVKRDIAISNAVNMIVSSAVMVEPSANSELESANSELE